MYLTFAALESILNVAMSYKLSSLDENELKSIMQFYSKFNNSLFWSKSYFSPKWAENINSLRSRPLLWMWTEFDRLHEV